MTAAIENLTIEQGATFSRVVNVSESGVLKNLTGYLARAQIRRTAGNASIVQAITCTLTDAVNGEITITISAADTAALTDTNGVWDMELDDQGGTPVVIRLLKGKVSISPNVTR